jgi:hypothetical protein
VPHVFLCHAGCLLGEFDPPTSSSTPLDSTQISTPHGLLVGQQLRPGSSLSQQQYEDRQGRSPSPSRRVSTPTASGEAATQVVCTAQAAAEALVQQQLSQQMEALHHQQQQLLLTEQQLQVCQTASGERRKELLRMLMILRPDLAAALSSTHQDDPAA